MIIERELAGSPGIPWRVLAGAGMLDVGEAKKSSNRARWASAEVQNDIVLAKAASKQVFEML